MIALAWSCSCEAYSTTRSPFFLAAHTAKSLQPVREARLWGRPSRAPDSAAIRTGDSCAGQCTSVMAHYFSSTASKSGGLR